MAFTEDQLAAALPGLWGYARALTRDEDAAADLVQETALAAWEKADQFRGESGVATWLHRIMYHRFIDATRRRLPVPISDEELLAANERAWADDAYTVSAEVVLERAEDRAALQEALIRLPASHRSAVLLHDLEQMTAAQVAEVQRIGVPAAKQRIRRGRQLLVSALASGAERRAALGGVPLNCWTARSRILDYLDGDLSASERSQVEGHLAGCPTCPALYASIVGVTGALAAMRDPDSVIPDGIAERVRATTMPRR
ncbi:MAG: sigma-70 family RNA polymerase sigma factor [Propionibacteriales bacterium]|nr:sigma-70 family RNA polymerase sigma factor [Propionibacteriales bacterium]